MSKFMYWGSAIVIGAILGFSGVAEDVFDGVINTASAKEETVKRHKTPVTAVTKDVKERLKKNIFNGPWYVELQSAHFGNRRLVVDYVYLMSNGMVGVPVTNSRGTEIVYTTTVNLYPYNRK